jgi:hypothetical protein
MQVLTWAYMYEKVLQSKNESVLEEHVLENNT